MPEFATNNVPFVRGRSRPRFTGGDAIPAVRASRFHSSLNRDARCPVAASFAVVFLVLIGFYALQKLAVPLGGKDRVQFALLMMYGLAGILVVRGIAQPDVRKTLLYLAVVATGSVSILCHYATSAVPVSLASFALCVVVYLPCVLAIRMERNSYENVLRAFVTLGLVAAALVGFNWLTQIVGLGMPINLDKILPEPMIFREYVYTQPISWRSLYTKPNAVFFLETSVLSQFLATTLLIEVCFFKRLWALGAIAVALAATFGGTGLLLVALSLPFVLPYLHTSFVIAGAILSPVVLTVAYLIGLLDNIIHRSGDFDRQGSSADDRFTKQFTTLHDFFSGDWGQIFLGYGPGSLTSETGSNYFVPLVKAFYEYGFVFALLWLAFSVTICFGKRVPVVVGAAGFISLHVVNSSFLVPLFIYIPLLLSGAYHLHASQAADPMGRPNV